MEKSIDWWLHCARVEYHDGVFVEFTDRDLEYCKALCRNVYKNVIGFKLAQIKSGNKVVWQYWKEVEKK